MAKGINVNGSFSTWWAMINMYTFLLHMQTVATEILSLGFVYSSAYHFRTWDLVYAEKKKSNYVRKPEHITKRKSWDHGFHHLITMRGNPKSNELALVPMELSKGTETCETYHNRRSPFNPGFSYIHSGASSCNSLSCSSTSPVKVENDSSLKPNLTNIKPETELFYQSRRLTFVYYLQIARY